MVASTSFRSGSYQFQHPSSGHSDYSKYSRSHHFQRSPSGHSDHSKYSRSRYFQHSPSGHSDHSKYSRSHHFRHSPSGHSDHFEHSRSYHFQRSPSRHPDHFEHSRSRSSNNRKTLRFQSDYETAEYVAKRPRLLKIAIQMAQYEGIEIENEIDVATSSTSGNIVLDQKVSRLFYI